MAKPLLEKIKLEDALMDGAYDKEEVFKFLKEKGVNLPGIKIRYVFSSYLCFQIFPSI